MTAVVNVETISDDDVEAHTVTSEPEVATQLSSLKNRRAEIVKNLFVDLKVPRWEDPEIWVRYSPISPVLYGKLVEDRRAALERSNNRVNVANRAAFLANCDALVQHCDGVYAVLDGDHDTQYSLRVGDPLGPPTKFDNDLAENLGFPEITRAVEVVQKLYLTEGDLTDAAARLLDFSMQANEQAEQDFTTP